MSTAVAVKPPAAWQDLLLEDVVQEVHRIHGLHKLPFVNAGRFELGVVALPEAEFRFLRPIFDIMKKVIVEHFDGDPAAHHPDFAVLSTLKDGGIHPYHADNVKRVGTKWVPNHTPHRTYSGILYLNTPPAGGEIDFPQHKIMIRPRPGLVVGFPSSGDYVHGVRPVTAGERHALVFWFSDQDAFRLRG